MTSFFICSSLNRVHMHTHNYLYTRRSRGRVNTHSKLQNTMKMLRRAVWLYTWPVVDACLVGSFVRVTFYSTSSRAASKKQGNCYLPQSFSFCRQPATTCEQYFRNNGTEHLSALGSTHHDLSTSSQHPRSSVQPSFILNTARIIRI